MKKILILILCGITLIAKSQNASVEQSTFGIQIGTLGIWVHNESKLSNQIALRSEIGFDIGVYGKDADNIEGYMLVPSIALEPRWYYNLNKRECKSRRIDNNSGNFISIKAKYDSDWFVIFNKYEIDFISSISIVPTWGIRRNIGNHFNYETGIGIGYIHYYKKENQILMNESDIDVNLHLRIGYRF